jgi:hypothetical protein
MLLCVGPFTYAPGEGPVVAKRLAQSRKGVCDLCQLDGGPEQTRAAVDVVVVVAICRLVSRAATGRVGFLHCASLRAVLSLADGILRHFCAIQEPEAILEGHHASGCSYVPFFVCGEDT